MNDSERYEIKFILNAHELFQFRQKLILNTTFKNTFDSRIVNSIYFDDVNNMSAADNLSGISNRKKYRLRWYGDCLNDQVIFEVKIRKNKIGYKEYFSLPKEPQDLNKLELRHIARMFDKALDLKNKNPSFQLFPKLQLAYSREYFENKEGIRLTIDDQIKFWEIFEESLAYNGIPINYEKKIIELKFSKELYPNVVNFLRNTSMLPKRHSKYLVGLAKLGEAKYI